MDRAHARCHRVRRAIMTTNEKLQLIARAILNIAELTHQTYETDEHVVQIGCSVLAYARLFSSRCTTGK